MMQSFKMLLRMTALSFILIGLSITSSHSAMVEYSYQGNLFTSVVDQNPPSGTSFSLTDSINGSFIVSNFLGADLNNQNVSSLIDSWTFTAGSVSLSSTDGKLRTEDFVLSTDAAGVITGWDISVMAGDLFPISGEIGDPRRGFDLFNVPLIGAYDLAYLDECIEDSIGGDCSVPSNFQSDIGSTRDNPGTWTSPQVGAVPIPAAIWLFGTALIGLVGFGRQRKSA